MRNNWLNTQQLAYMALVVCIIAEATMSHFRIGPLPLRVYVLLMFLIVGSMATLYTMKPIRMSFPLMALIIFAFIAALHQLQDISSGQFWYYLMRGLGASALVFMLTVVVLRNRYEKLDSILAIYIAIVSVSAFVCLMQALGVEFFWKLRDWVPTDLDDEIGIAIQERNRPVGLALNSVEIAYQICIVFPLAMYMMHKATGIKKIAYKGLIVLLVLGAVASQTRSALIGLIVSYSMMKLAITGLRGFKLKRLSMPIVMGAVLIFLSLGVGLSERAARLDDSAQGKVFLVYMGLLYMQSHPMGSGILMKDFFQFKEDAIGLFAEYGEAVSSQVERYTPHNQFVNTGVMFGWAGLLLLIYFYRRLWTDLGRLRATQQDSGLAVALQASLAGYILNSLFHNAGPFVGDPMAWYVIGIISAVISRNSNSERTKFGDL